MFQKGLFVVESFVTIGSFDYDYIHMQPIWIKDVKEFLQTSQMLRPLNIIQKHRLTKRT